MALCGPVVANVWLVHMHAMCSMHGMQGQALEPGPAVPLEDPQPGYSQAAGHVAGAGGPPGCTKGGATQPAAGAVAPLWVRPRKNNNEAKRGVFTPNQLKIRTRSVKGRISALDQLQLA